MNASTFLNAMLDIKLNEYIGTDTCFIVDTIDYIGTLSSKSAFKSILNSTMYQWYYGNILNKIIMMVFQPYLYLNVDGIEESEHKYLSKKQVQEALRVCYSMIVEFGVKYDQVDYYGQTIIKYLTRDVLMIKNLPRYIVEYIPAFKFIFRNGPNVLQIQCSLVKNWLEKRKRAAILIASYWVEILYSPYTRLGKSKIQKLACNFYVK